MKKLFLLTTFFTITPLLLIATTLYFSYLAYNNHGQSSILSFLHPTKNVAYAAYPASFPFIQVSVNQTDARTEIVRQFLRRYKSPLETYADEIVSIADKYNLDYRLLPAIAAQESNLCTKIPDNSYNCWGFGIYGGKIQKFDNYSQAIDVVSKTLAVHYVAKGLNTPEEIMHKYTPSSNGSWAFGVSHFMDQLQFPPGT